MHVSGRPTLTSPMTASFLEGSLPSGRLLGSKLRVAHIPGWRRPQTSPKSTISACDQTLLLLYCKWHHLEASRTITVTRRSQQFELQCKAAGKSERQHLRFAAAACKSCSCSSTGRAALRHVVTWVTCRCYCSAEQHNSHSQSFRAA